MKSDRASSTAKVIAASTILLAEESRGETAIPRSAVALCRIFLSTSFADRSLAWGAAHRPVRWLLRALEQATLPGIIDHYWRRKRWIERRCRSALEEGFQRVVIVGAGFDTLGIRLAPEFGEVKFVELDHPATQAIKKSALQQGKVVIPSNLRFTDLDLTNEEMSPDDCSGESTLFIMEGLLMYLPEEKIASLFRLLHGGGGARVRVIFSFMSQWPDGTSGFRPHSRLIHWWLAWRGERFTWAINPESVRSLLASWDFELKELALARALEENGAEIKTRLDGENLVVCENVRCP